MARKLATDVAYELNRIPGGVWNKAFAEGRDAVNFFGGIQPMPRGAGINDNGILIPIYYSQNSSFVPFAEGDANPTAGHATKKYFTQPFQRYHGAAGIDGLLDAINQYQGFGLGEDAIVSEMMDLFSAGFNAINADLMLDGTGTSSKALRGMLYHVTNTGTWNGTNKSGAAYLQSYLDSNAGTDRDLSKTLIDGVLDTMRYTRQVSMTDVVFGATAYHAYEREYSDYRMDVSGRRDIYLPEYGLDGMKVSRLPVDTNYIFFLRKQDWNLYYLPQRVYANDQLTYVEGPWAVEQSPTGYDSKDFVVRIYLTLVCKNPWGQAGLFDVQ